MKKVLSILLASAMALSLVACGGGDTSTPSTSTPSTSTPAGDSGYTGGEYTISLGHICSENTTLHRACLEFEKFVEAESGGAIQIEIHPNSVLGGDEAMIEMCAEGTVTMMIPSTCTMEMYAPEWAIASIPYLYQSPEDCFEAMDGAVGDYLKATLDGTDYVCVGFNSNGIRSMTNNVRPITQADDLDGIKMRVMSSATYVDWMNALGANATPMGYNELFSSLQSGTVDGQENAPSMIWESAFYEVQSYLSITEHVYDLNAIIVNRNFYESLTDEEKEIFDTGVQTYMIEQQRDAEIGDTQSYIDQIEGEGSTEVNYLDDAAKQTFRDKLADFYAEYREKLGDEIWDLVAQYQ